jgi:hypothetical protein
MQMRFTSLVEHVSQVSIIDGICKYFSLVDHAWNPSRFSFVVGMCHISLKWMVGVLLAFDISLRSRLQLFHK